MTQDSDVSAVLDVVTRIMTAAGCASLITLDEVGLPSSRPVRTFLSDDGFAKITIPSDVNSRKTHHVGNNPNVVLSYVDTPSRGYVTIIGQAELIDSPEDMRAAWVDPLSAFWPDGPESDEFILIVVTPERIETRSYTQGVADLLTRWTPVTLTRTNGGVWQTVI